MFPPLLRRAAPLLACVLSFCSVALFPALLIGSTLLPPPHPDPNPPPDTRPVVTGGAVSTVAGQPFTYYIRATNSPTGYGFINGPAELILEAGSGRISGTPTYAGSYTLILSATNAAGTNTQELQLVVFQRPIPAVDIVSEKDATIFDGKVTPGSFLITRTGGDAADPVKVGFTVAGGAGGGVDYKILRNAANIRGDKGVKHLKVVPIDQGATVATKRVVKVTLQTGIGYTLGAQTTAKLKVLTNP